MKKIITTETLAPDSGVEPLTRLTKHREEVGGRSWKRLANLIVIAETDGLL